MKEKVLDKRKAEEKIDNSLAEIVELLNDLTWGLKPMGLDNQGEESTDTEGSSGYSIADFSKDDDDEDQHSAMKVFRRQQQMALLGMDASTSTIVPKTGKPTGTGRVPVSQQEIEELRSLLDKQQNLSKEGKFDESKQAEVCNVTGNC